VDENMTQPAWWPEVRARIGALLAFLIVAILVAAPLSLAADPASSQPPRGKVLTGSATP
jgi:hypothetical protein